MRVRFVALVVAALSLGVTGVYVHADDTKKDDPAANDKAKADKKDDGGGCDEGCEGCKDAKTSSKAIECKDCASSEKGPCEKCQTALKEGKVFFVPVSGMSCSMCEAAVGAKLDKVEGIKNYAASHRFNSVAVFVEPGKTVKLSDIETALGKGRFKIDETAKLAGKYTLRIDGVTDEKVAASICETICKSLGIENCKNCSNCFDCKTGTFTIDATDKKITIKSIKDKLTECKLTLAGIEFHGPKVEAATTPNTKG